jgi:hypothetical protein
MAFKLLKDFQLAKLKKYQLINDFLIVSANSHITQIFFTL